MLSCSCDIDGSDWTYYPPNDFVEFDEIRRKRCCSCNSLIDHWQPSLKFQRARDPRTDIEECIWGDEVYMAPWHMCEWCGEIFLNLDALGYCHNLGDSIKEDLEDYWDLTGFTPSG